MNNVALILVLEVVLLGCGAAFLHQKDPAGFTRVVTDVQQLVSDAISNTGTTTTPLASPGVPVPPPPASTAQTTNPSSIVPPPSMASTATSVATPTAVTTSASPAPVAPTTPWTPPAVLPAQPNWTWTTISGQVYNNVKVLSVDRDSAMIMYDGGGERVPLAYLPPYLQKMFNYTPSVASSTGSSAPAVAGVASPVATSASLSPVLANLVGGDLVRFSNNSVQPISNSVLAPVRYLAIYYSAQWCPPCHAFTPKLVQFYNSFKVAHPDFDLIFVSEDHDENQMHDYMQEMAMPWPAIPYSQLQHPPGTFKGTGIEGFANNGIPDLVLIDSTGKVLADSYQGDTYVGPETVVDQIQSLVK